MSLWDRIDTRADPLWKPSGRHCPAGLTLSLILSLADRHVGSARRSTERQLPSAADF